MTVNMLTFCRKAPPFFIEILINCQNAVDLLGCYCFKIPVGALSLSAGIA